MGDDAVACRTPTPDKRPTRIAGWKFAVVREAILDVIPPDPPGLPFAELASEVRRRLDDATLARLGSVAWYATTVKLELEVRGELVRLPGSPQHLIRRLG